MWKNRGVNQSTDKLLTIAGIAAISLAMGWSDETKIDNLGRYSRPPVIVHVGGRRGGEGRGGGGGKGWASC